MASLTEMHVQPVLAFGASRLLVTDSLQAQPGRHASTRCLKGMHCGEMHALLSATSIESHHACMQSLAADLLSTAGEVAQHPALSSGLMRFHLCQTLAYAYFYQGR